MTMPVSIIRFYANFNPNRDSKTDAEEKND
jgi:hypothetical protein